MEETLLNFVVILVSVAPVFILVSLPFSEKLPSLFLDPSEREVSSIRDDTSSEKEMPTRMERSASEGERPTELMIIPSTSFEDEGSKNRDGSLSEIRRSTRMKTSSTETKMTIKFRGVSSMTESCPSEVEDSNTRD